MSSQKTVGFALEYSLGHATHAENLKSLFSSGALPEIDPRFVDVRYDDRSGAWSNLPLARSNWTVRGSLRARAGIRSRARSLDAALFHTQVISIFSASLMRRIPSVISLDATPVQIDSLGAAYGHVPSRNSRIEAIKRRLTIRALDSARRLVTWSDWTRDSLVNDYKIAPSKIEVIPPGVDLSLWQPRAAARGEDRVVRLLFVGGDFARKGGETLLEALRLLPRPISAKIELDIVTRSEVSVPTTDFPATVRVHGNVSANSPALRELFSRADVFVFPTRGDCLPLAVLEALASGLPIVSTPVGALREPVIDRRTGLIVAPDDPAALADSIGELVENPSLRATLARQARELSRERYDLIANYSRLARLTAGL